MKAHAAPAEEPVPPPHDDDAYGDALRNFMDLADRRGLSDHLVREVLSDR